MLQRRLTVASARSWEYHCTLLITLPARLRRVIALVLLGALVGTQSNCAKKVPHDQVAQPVKKSAHTADQDKLLSLTLAIVYHNDAEAYRLIEEGADLRARDGRGNTALFYAAGRPWVPSADADLVRKLIEKGADVNAACMGGFTPLHSACDTGQLEAVACLLNHGANAKLQDNYGHTPLHVAASRETETGMRTEIVKLLLQHGADIRTKNNEGKTALDFAREYNGADGELIRLLAGTPAVRPASRASDHSHDLRGSNSGRCSECGEPIPSRLEFANVVRNER